MRKLAFVLIGAIWGTAFSQDLLECVNPDVLSGLIFRSSNDEGAVFSAALPAQMTGVTTPSEFEWIGSAERPTGIAAAVTAAFRTELAPEAAADTAMASLSESGWEVQPRRSIGGGVFSQPQITSAQTACRDASPVSVSASELDGTTYVTYSFSTSPTNTVCNSSDPRSAFGLADGIAQHMPTLEFPPDPVTGQPVVSRGVSSGGGTNVRYSSTQIVHNESLGNLANFLSQQLFEQGWVPDTSWTGTTTAGSSWSRQADVPVQGMLKITAMKNSRYDVMFRVVALQ